MTDDVIARLQATREAVTAGLHDARREVIDVCAGTQVASRPRRWATTASVAAVAASVVAAVVLAGVATHLGGSSGTAGSSGNDAIAAGSAAASPYTYVRRTTVAGDKRVVDEWWIPQALGGTWKYDQIGTDAITVGACTTIRAADQCPTRRADGTWRDPAGSWSAPSRQFVQHLPLDAAALLAGVESDAGAHVSAGNSAHGGDPASSRGASSTTTSKALLAIGNLQNVLESGYATRDLDAAIEQALSRMTGVVTVDGAVTANGTRGTGFAYEPDPKSPVRAVAVVFSADGTYVGTGIAHPDGATGPGLPAGGRTSLVTSFETAQVNALGEQP